MSADDRKKTPEDDERRTTGEVGAPEPRVDDETVAGDKDDAKTTHRQD